MKKNNADAKPDDQEWVEAFRKIVKQIERKLNKTDLHTLGKTKMKKPNEFKDWCKLHNIQPKSHDESVAWAAWTKCYQMMVEKFNQEFATSNAKKK